jgi:site-specific DNA-cytosine methylase
MENHHREKNPDPKANELGYTSKAHLAKAKRLQGLPDDFHLPGMTVEGAMKAIGNGVPLFLGRALAMAVREALSTSIKEEIDSSDNAERRNKTKESGYRR